MMLRRPRRTKKRPKLVAADDALDVDEEGVIEIDDGFSSDGTASGGALPQAGAAAAPRAALWADAHAPAHTPALVMSTVTVNKVRRWMAAAVAGDVLGHPRMLILTGPPGAGKSSAVRILGTELGAEVAEWHAPLPNDADVATSRTLLESMQAFLVGVRYPSLMQGHASPSRRLLLIDDVPLSVYDSKRAHDRSDQFRSMLQAVANSSPNPTVVVLSDSNKARAKTARVMGLDFFDSPNVLVINVKQATEASMAKALEAVTKQENRRLLPDSLNALITASQGDIRSALNSLHLYCAATESDPTQPGNEDGSVDDVGMGARHSRQRTSRGRSATAKRSRKPGPVVFRTELDHVPGVGGDASLDTYHAVSKVLNNKKDSRGASKYNPEQILTDARTEPVAFVAFLHQNYPQFFSSADDAAEALELLSESETLTTWRQDDALRTSLGDCAASVVTRAFLISNRDPIRTGWRPVHGTEHFAIQKQADDTIRRARSAFDVVRSGVARPARSLATDLLPYSELMRHRTSSLATQRAERAVCRYVYAGHGSSRAHPQSLRPSKGIDSADLAMLSEEEAAKDTGVSAPVASIGDRSALADSVVFGPIGDDAIPSDEIEDYLSD